MTSFRLYSAFILLLATAVASESDHPTPYLRRVLRIGDKVTLCAMTSELSISSSVNSSTTFVQQTYQTRSMKPLDAWRYLRRKNVKRGSCKDKLVCESVCRSFAVHTIEGDTCLCRSSPSSPPSLTKNTTTTDQLKENATPTTNTTCGINTKIVPASTSSTSSCQCLLGFEGNPLLGCTDRNECSAPAIITGSNTSMTAQSTPPSHSCASNQQCINTVGSFVCQPRNCLNPYGNPCGPATACTDAPTGFVCTPLYNATFICPGGSCPSTEVCVPAGSSNRTTAVASCQCQNGYHRPVVYLPCVSL